MVTYADLGSDEEFQRASPLRKVRSPLPPSLPPHLVSGCLGAPNLCLAPHTTPASQLAVATAAALRP